MTDKKQQKPSTSNKTNTIKDFTPHSHIKSAFAQEGLSPSIAIFGTLFIYFASWTLALQLFVTLRWLFGEGSSGIAGLLQDSLTAQAVVMTFVVLFVFSLTYGLLKLTNTSLKQIGFTKYRHSHVLTALLGYGWYMLLFVSTTFLISTFVPQIDLDQQQQLGFDRSTTGLGLLIIGFSLVVLPALYEELLMRGVLFTGLRKKISFMWTLVGVSLLFGAAHLEFGGYNPLNWAAAIDTFMLSAVLIYLRETCKSIWPAIILHGIKNLVAFTLVFVFKVV